MPKPLQSQDNSPKDTRFSTFGVLDTGKRSPASAVTAIVINVSLAALLLYVGMLVKANPIVAKKVATLTLPDMPEKQPPPPPKPPPPPPPKLPPTPKMPELPKVTPPPEKIPDIKPVEMPVPKPVVTPPAPPLKVSPPPAPKVVNLSTPAPASVPNHDIHPSAVRLGAQDNPMKPVTGPAVANVNLGSAGAPGMPKSNSGNGAPATVAGLGSGAPRSTDMAGRDRGAQPVPGFGKGVLGSTGPKGSPGLTNVAINAQPAAVKPVSFTPAKTAKLPTVTYKPDPAYTAEAKALHLQGNVSLRIRVSATGVVQVLGVVQGLGHGLDESAIEAAKATKFRPAVDAAGNPIEWEGVVLVKFQLG